MATYMDGHDMTRQRAVTTGVAKPSMTPVFLGEKLLQGLRGQRYFDDTSIAAHTCSLRSQHSCLSLSSCLKAVHPCQVPFQKTTSTSSLTVSFSLFVVDGDGPPMRPLAVVGVGKQPASQPASQPRPAQSSAFSPLEADVSGVGGLGNSSSLDGRYLRVLAASVSGLGRLDGQAGLRSCPSVPAES